jgi:hypothetical protein
MDPSGLQIEPVNDPFKAMNEAALIMHMRLIEISFLPVTVFIPSFTATFLRKRKLMSLLLRPDIRCRPDDLFIPVLRKKLI